MCLYSEMLFTYNARVLEVTGDIIRNQRVGDLCEKVWREQHRVFGLEKVLASIYLHQV